MRISKRNAGNVRVLFAGIVFFSFSPLLMVHFTDMHVVSSLCRGHANLCFVPTIVHCTVFKKEFIYLAVLILICSTWDLIP